MKIIGINGVSVSESGENVTSINESAISFQKMDNNTHRAITKVAFATAEDGSTSVEATVPITVSTDTEPGTNKRRYRRSMVKVTIPYTAIKQDLDMSGSPVIETDATRSGGTVEAHIVVTLPRAAEADLKGNNGSVCQMVAVEHLQIALSALAGMCGGALSPVTVRNADGGANPAAFRVPIVGSTIPDETEIIPLYKDDEEAGSFGDVRLEGPNLLRARPGIRWEEIDNPFTRVLNGLPMIGEDDVSYWRQAVTAKAEA